MLKTTGAISQNSLFFFFNLFWTLTKSYYSWDWTSHDIFFFSFHSLTVIFAIHSSVPDPAADILHLQRLFSPAHPLCRISISIAGLTEAQQPVGPNPTTFLMKGQLTISYSTCDHIMLCCQIYTLPIPLL